MLLVKGFKLADPETGNQIFESGNISHDFDIPDIELKVSITPELIHFY